MINTNYDILIVGGGAAGFFTAINIAEQNPNYKIALLEKGKETLTKVKISGGGRCNVTHACFVPNDLSKFYPRGEKELKGPFHEFCTGDTMEWFEKRGVSLKIEEDGRIFPTTDSSQTIIDCFLNACQKLSIDILTLQNVNSIFPKENGWKVETQNQTFFTQKLIMTTGSNPKIWEIIKALGHTIVPPVPSLFTFNIKDERIKDLMGVSTVATISIKNLKLKSTGPLLITHWGMSGPGILRLSAWGARELHQLDYKFDIKINWLVDLTIDDVMEELKQLKDLNAKKIISKFSPFDIPKRLWEKLILASKISLENKWADISKKGLISLANELVNSHFKVNGKSIFKEEFVTAGGVDLKEINFKTMESKLFPNLYFAGEITNIDAITGGFNFQNAWTSGFIISKSI